MGTFTYDNLIRPQSGVRQGCPLSPTLFAMLIFPIIRKLQGISDSISVLLYVDDLLIIIHHPPLTAAQHMLSIGQELDVFREHTGPTANLSKSAILLKGSWPVDLQATLAMPNIPIKYRYKYLGVIIGHVTSEAAYGPVLQKALGRAFSMQHSKLSLRERVELLKLWTLPLVVYPTAPVISTLRTIYSVALRLNSWGIIPSILSLP